MIIMFCEDCQKKLFDSEPFTEAIFRSVCIYFLMTQHPVIIEKNEDHAALKLKVYAYLEKKGLLVTTDLNDGRYAVKPANTVEYEGELIVLCCNKRGDMSSPPEDYE